MRKDVCSRVGILLGTVGILYTIIIAVKSMVRFGSFEDITAVDYINLVNSLFLYALSLSRKAELVAAFGKRHLRIRLIRLNMVWQFWTVALLTLHLILTDYGSDFIIGMIIATIMIGYRYKLLTKIQLLILIIIYVALIELMASLVREFLMSLPVTLFFGFFFGSMVMLYQDDMERHFRTIRRYRNRVLVLEDTLSKLQGDTIDISDLNFTSREVEVLRELCLNRSSNSALAEALGIKEQTVKTHIKNIFDKAGVDDRYQLIDLFKGNFQQESGDSAGCREDLLKL